MITILCVCFAAYLFAVLTKGRCKSSTCLVGKTAIVTGGNSGIGYHVVQGLAARGCRVIIADIADSTQSQMNIVKWTGNPNVICKYINLASFASIREFSRDINETEERLDILVNNAGCGLFQQSGTEDGCNIGMQVNHFGGFLLTHLLIDLLKTSAPSRIIFTSSLLAFINNLSVNNLNNSVFMIYANSKLCNMISAKGFSEKLLGTDVTAYSVHPGLVNTSIFRKVNNTENKGIFYYISQILYNTVLPIYAKTPEEGAEAILHVALSKQVEPSSEKFFSDCKSWNIVPSKLKNTHFCEKIWSLSEELCKLKTDEKL